MDVREKLEVIAHLCDHITYKEDIGICYDSALAKVIENAYMELKNGVTVQEWISVDDRLPEEKANCIVHYQHSYCDNDGYWAIGMCFYDGEKFQLNPAYKITHWMPLPEPPKGE